MQQEFKNNPNEREARERRRIQSRLSTKDYSITAKPKKISHILPGEQLNVFQWRRERVVLTNCRSKRNKKNRFCTRCGEMGHGRRYCQVNTWCKFCIMDTHATQACRKYENFVKDNPIASSRRNTPVQVQGQRAAVNPTERPQQPLFPHPPMQRYNPTVIPQIAVHNLTPKDEERESREHSQKIATKPNEGGTDPDVKTIPSPKELPGRLHGSTLPETSTVCRD